MSLSRRELFRASFGLAILEIARPVVVLAEDHENEPTTEEVFSQEESKSPDDLLIDRPELSNRGQEREQCTQVWIGECTYYSHAGCVGCSPNQIMANGRKFNENAMTMAFMRVPLGALVTVENLDTGVKVEGVEVTDRGGFEKYGILADLSLGLSRRIGNRSRESRIKITLEDC